MASATMTVDIRAIGLRELEEMLDAAVAVAAAALPYREHSPQLATALARLSAAVGAYEARGDGDGKD
jgi:hypothetical protein